jgi:hypothetical protein
MTPEQIVLNDGRKLLDVWAAVRDMIEDDDSTAFVAIPEGG